MQNDIQRQILGAFLVALRPIAKILLQFGIGFREFAEIAKTAFVDVATREYGLRGRPTNISRVAVMTGLTRKEVRRLREKINEGHQAVVVKQTPLEEIMHRWHAEPEYLDQSGRPRPLPFAGEEKSFTSLVKRFGGDIPPGAMRTELKRVGAVRELQDGNLEVLSRTIYAKGAEDKLIVALVRGIYPLLETVAHNLNPENKDNLWTQKTAYSLSIRSEDLPRLRRISLDRLTDVAESIDDLFMAYETLHDNEKLDGQKSTVAVGVYYFEEIGQETTADW